MTHFSPDFPPTLQSQLCDCTPDLLSHCSDKVKPKFWDLNPFPIKWAIPSVFFLWGISCSYQPLGLKLQNGPWLLSLTFVTRAGVSTPGHQSFPTLYYLSPLIHLTAINFNSRCFSACPGSLLPPVPPIHHRVVFLKPCCQCCLKAILSSAPIWP